MKIAQISTGFLEVPGQISLNIFTQGCNINCPGCQNQELIPLENENALDYSCDELLEAIQLYKMPTYICWMGGEPTIWIDEIIKVNEKLHELGYLICL